MIRRPTKSTRTDTLFPDATLFRSGIRRLLSEAVIVAVMMADGPRRSSTLRPAQNIRPPPDVPGPRILSVVEGHRLLDRGLVERIGIQRVSRFWIVKGEDRKSVV